MYEEYDVSELAHNGESDLVGRLLTIFPLAATLLVSTALFRLLF